MAKKRHGGLGRGLDALIPMAGINRSNIYNENSDAGQPDKEASSGQPDGIFSPGQPDGKEMSGTDAGGSSSSVNVSGTDWEGSPAAVNVSGTDWGGSSGTANESGAGWGASPGPVNTGVQMLRLSQVDPNRSQPRRIFEEDALDELADSIRQFGVLQPILVQKKDGRYEIIAGERRWRACRKAWSFL